LEPHRPHQPGNRAAGRLATLAPQLPPDLPYPVDLEVRVPHPPDVAAQLGIALGSFRQLGRIVTPRRATCSW
jgi:hypothetical protein